MAAPRHVKIKLPTFPHGCPSACHFLRLPLGMLSSLVRVGGRQFPFPPCWLPEPTCYGTSNRHFYRAAGPRPNDVSQELCSGLSPLNSHPPLSPDLPASWPPACLLRRCSKGQGGAENMDLRTVLDFLLFAITMQFWRRLSSLGGGSLFLATLPT